MFKKYLVAASAASLLISMAGVSALAVKPASVPGPWTLTAPSDITFVCGGGNYTHTLDTVSNDSSGSFTGTGHYVPDNSYTWDITGNITDTTITFTIIYTGTNAGYTLNGIGTIASDGSITGTTDGNCQTFSMTAGSAVQFTGNHGQWVSSQTDKQDAAQSRVGMPVQSKGHTQ